MTKGTNNPFEQFRKETDLAPLRKLEVGEQFTARKTGWHTFKTEDGDELPVLEVDDAEPPFAWLAGGWHALQELADAAPEDGEIVRVRRLANRGRSHQFEIRVLDEDGRELPVRFAA